jgi:hypothetical protein
MSSILYYSSYCNNCNKLLQILSKSKLKEEVHFLCIDKRKKGNDNALYVVLENGQEVLLPPQITKVPALLLLNQGHHVLFGEQVYKHLQPRENSFTQTATNNNGEPMAFSLFGGQMGISSDAYSYLDQSSDDLSAKGNGGMRQQHHYASLTDDQRIQSPPEDYVPNKIGKQGITLEELQQKRSSDEQKLVRQ